MQKEPARAQASQDQEVVVDRGGGASRPSFHGSHHARWAFPPSRMTSCPRLHMACIVQSGIADQSTQNAGSNITASCIIAARTLCEVPNSRCRCTTAGRSQLFQTIQTSRKGPKISQKGANIGRQVCKQKGTMHVHPYTDGRRRPSMHSLTHACKGSIRLGT